jgi:DNA-binding transcriptional MerR regulator
MMADRLIAPDKIAKDHKISYQTINYYTNLGLLVVKKKEGNRRFYNAREVRDSLLKIEQLKNKGYSLKLICDVIREQK